MRPGKWRRIDSTAARSPSWSRSALPRGGGPCGREWRKGRSQRRTARPDAPKASARATRSGALQLAPAPWVRMRQSMGDRGAGGGWWRNPRTGTSPEVSRNSRKLCISQLNATVHAAGDYTQEGDEIDAMLFAAPRRDAGDFHWTPSLNRVATDGASGFRQPIPTRSCS